MKNRLIMLLLLAMLLTGCDSEGRQEKVQENVQGNAQENVQQNIPENAQGSVSENTQENAQENVQTEQQPYVVSFQANTIDGQAFTSDNFADSKITMINVWATYCNPCLAEMPDLGDIAESYPKSELQMIGIISDVVQDASEEDVQRAKDLIRQTEADYTHLLLNESLYQNLVGGIEAVPTTFFVNSKGELLTYQVGAKQEDEWERIIEDLLLKEGVVTEEYVEDALDDKFDDDKYEINERDEIDE